MGYELNIKLCNDPSASELSIDRCSHKESLGLPLQDAAYENPLFGGKARRRITLQFVQTHTLPKIWYDNA